MALIGYFSAILMGLSLGLIGGGGSILTVPILVYFFKLDGVTATTHSLFVVGAISLMGAFQNARQGFVDFKMGSLFAVPSFLGIFLVRKIIMPLIPDSFILPLGLTMTKSLLVLMSFSVIMILASRAMIRAGKKNLISQERGGGFLNIATKGFFVGCITGFVGAGGGFLIVPALVLLLHLPMRRAIGTSLAIIAANSLFGFTVSLNDQAIQWSLLFSLTALGISGLLIGHRISPHIPENKLKQSFGYFVLLVGILVLIDQCLKLI